MQTNTKKTFSIFWTHAKRYWISGLTVVVAVILGSVLNVLPPLFYKQFFDTIVAAQVPGEHASELVRIIGYIFLLHSGAWVCWRIATFTASYFQVRVMVALSNTSFAYVHKHSFSFFQNNFVGSLVKRVNRFTFAYEAITDSLYWDILPMLVQTIGITIVLWFQNAILGAIVCVWIVLFVCINYAFTRYKLRYDIRQSALDSKTTGILADTVTNQGNIKLFTGYEREKKYYETAIEEMQKLRMFRWNMENVFEAVQVAFMIALEFGIFYLAIGFWEKGIISVGDFVLIQAYMLSIFSRFWSFGKLIRRIYENIANAEEMTEIFETPIEIVDKKNAKELVVKKGEVTFQKVSFYYHKTRPLFTQFSLRIAPGERVALVGPSGGGKSSMVKMLLRIHDVSGGHILIDGQRIDAVTQESLHRAISLVPQDPVLFHRTLMENIRYGKPDATDEEVFEAARQAHCHEFIQTFPEKYDTFVGERGVKLSGGERQRVAIARAILRNAPILILDEATSSLDSESEALIQDALKHVMKGKTVFTIAHRLSTIMNMDRIIVLNNGIIIQEGTHRQLLKKKSGLYAKLWSHQAGGYL